MDGLFLPQLSRALWMTVKDDQHLLLATQFESIFGLRASGGFWLEIMAKRR